MVAVGLGPKQLRHEAVPRHREHRFEDARIVYPAGRHAALHHFPALRVRATGGNLLGLGRH
jgi:hypothetical protein